ncbi:zf-CCHC domain-containing protein/UBN2 domain-containing protein [Gossypium australe]|uniref:Zf-CCHC domain-containing protein/UBN2 domain-containing protein n=1 Tax=Gossypium australe TaxID=47621 RepID=A0A5B6UL45_9ROSI|nr:zf-CCHC domain-containing protein/UBN2 domain-containing protein [Gossypium australe]
MRPPLFNGSNYSYWRTRIELFIQANDYEVWRIITNGSFIPMKMVKVVFVPKEQSEWDSNDIKKIQLNLEAMHTLFCAFGTNDYNRVSLCNNPKEIWDKLEVNHEGKSRVKESKISLLTLDYELFKSKPEEGIKEISDHFTHIINGLNAPEKIYPNKEMVKKMLNSLPTSCEAKVMAIKESKDLNSLPLDEFIVKKNVGKALKSTTNNDSESSEEVDEGKEIEMFARRFKRFMRSNKGKEFQKKEGLKLESTKEKYLIICYECKKPGYIKYVYP